MRRLGETRTDAPRPIRVLQIGEGNFLRAFFDAMLDESNELGYTNAGVALIKPTDCGDLSVFKQQNGVFTVVLRGLRDGVPVQRGRVVRCVQRLVDPHEDFAAFLALAGEKELRFVVSNTTEAGIRLFDEDRASDWPPRSFPAKLTLFLYERFRLFSGDREKGLILLPTELIDDNGARLLEAVLECGRRFQLGGDFAAWVREACEFADTLVDRIVSGYPADAEALCSQLGYEDRLLTVGEPYALWAIRCRDPEALSRELPLDKAGQPVLYTRDLTPYRTRKLRLLNGAHTGCMPLAHLLGCTLVREAMEDLGLTAHMRAMLEEEVLPTIPGSAEESRAFLSQVLERFRNPYLDHKILSIAMNSTAKWRARILPSLQDSVALTGVLPRRLCFSLSALLALYLRAPEGLRDEAEVLAFFEKYRGRLHDLAFVREYLAAFQPEAGRIAGLGGAVAEGLHNIETLGLRAALRALSV